MAANAERGRTVSLQQAEAALRLWGDWRAGEVHLDGPPVLGEDRCSLAVKYGRGGGGGPRDHERAARAQVARWAWRVEQVLPLLDEQVRLLLWFKFVAGMGYDSARQDIRFPRAWNRRSKCDAPISERVFYEQLRRGVERVAGILSE